MISTRMLTDSRAARILADMKPLSELLREWRELLKLTPAEAARRCAMSAQHYWQLENGERASIRSSTLAKLVEGTGIPEERIAIAAGIEAAQRLRTPREPVPA